MLKRNISLTLYFLAWSCSIFAGKALAQANPELGDVQRTPPPAPVTVAQAPASRPAAAKSGDGPFDRVVATSGTDHAAMVGHFGVGFFGVMDLPVMGGTTMPDPTGTLAAPTLGARYWLSERMAIEAALGIGYRAGSTTTSNNGTSVDTNNPSLFGLALHGGLPLVFATSEHFAFEVVPELNLGFVTGGWNDTSPANRDVSLSGFLLELGARVGAEIQFGFIGIPQLALQGTVGLHMRYEGRSASSGPSDVSSHSFTFGTSVDGPPWQIFTGNLTAIYYF